MTLTDEVGLIEQPPTFASQEAINKYKLVVGISIGPDRASCSFAYKHDPFKIFEINNWNRDETDALVPSMVQDEEFPSIVKYTESDGNFLIGSKVLSQHTQSEEINVYDVIIDHLSGQNQVLSNFQNLDAEKVLSEFIKKLLGDANDIFGKIATEEEASFLAVYKGQPNAPVNAEIISRIKEKFKFSLDRCRYCVTGPQDQEYQNLMRQVFINTGTISEDDPQDRLIFVSDAEALGYYTISTSGYEDQYKYRFKYVICSINYNHVDFATISIDATQSTSAVVSYGINNVPEIQGWNPLEKLYHKYLLQSDPESEILDQQIETFKQEMKKSHFTFDGDKQELILAPFMEALSQTLSPLYDAEENIKRICYFGDIMSHPELYDYMENLEGKVTEMVEVQKNALSKGAVTRALRVANVQIPSSAETINADHERISLDLDDKPVSADDYDYIIGMDFGTTYSGCSFASTHNGDIHPIVDWPGNDRDSKAPTLLLYNSNSRTLENYWGNLAKSHAKKNSILLESFKLLISPKVIQNYYGPGNQTFEKIRKQNTFKHLQVKDMIVSYISKLNESAIKHIRDKEGFMSKLTRRKPKVKYVLTVPCMWTETAKATMLEAAVLAKLATREEDITIITEPEAAALCFDEIIRELGPLKSYFIVCDAGGGTVDLVTYAAVLEKNNQPSIRQVGEGCGGLCGSNRINHSFSVLLKECFPNQFVKRAEFLENIADNFERKKREFTGNEEFVKIQYLMKFKSKESIFKENCSRAKGCRVEGGYFIIPGSTMRQLFDHYVDETIELLEREYGRNKQEKNPVNHVLLVGGFSQSAYLQKKVEQWCDQYKIELAPVTTRLVTSVSYGAVSYGLNPRLVTKRNAGQSYALLLDQGNGVKSFDYFIQKSQEISSTHMSYKKIIKLDASESAVIAIYSSDKDTNIEHNFDDSFTKVLEVRLDEHCYQNTTSRTAEICLEFNATGVHCLVIFDKNDFVYNSAKGGNNVAYKLRYRGVRDDRNAVEVLTEFKNYAPLPSKGQ